MSLLSSLLGRSARAARALPRRVYSRLNPARMAADDDFVVYQRFTSEWGGFWTDLDNATGLLEGQRALGRLPDAVAEQLAFWIENGFVILPGAVPPELIDAVRADVAATLEGRGPQRQGTWWSADGHQKGVAHAGMMTQGEAKLLDMHAVSDAVQRAIFAPAIADFMTAVALRPMIAFQTLTFQYGSQQGIHQDTAFVRTNSPMEFMASWIALEDIQPDTGELEYYPRSHRLPEILYRDGSKWPAPGETVIDGYSDHIHTVAKEQGLTLQRFLPKKGDVLIWSADLAHGGSPITQPGQTRWSLVTHYCPHDRRPIYALKRRPTPPQAVADGRGFILSET